MPQVIPMVAYYAATYFGATALVATVIATAVSVAVNDYQRKKAAKQARDAFNASLEDRLVMTASVNGVRSRIYGECRNVDSVRFKATYGDNSQYYVMFVAFAGHECESIEKIYFNDQEVELVSDGAGGYWVYTEPYLQHAVVDDGGYMATVGTTATITLAHTPIAGSVVCTQILDGDAGSVDYPPTSVVGNLVTITGVDPGHTSIVCAYQYVSDIPKARIWKYLGTDAQDIGTDLLASRFPAMINVGTDPSTGLPNDDRFAGICGVVVEFQFDQDAFPAGLPQISGLVRGAKIYDPRTGLTAWTQNPSLIASDWALHANGGGCLAAEVQDPSTVANNCDVSTDFVTAAGIETRPLYQCDIVCHLDAPPDQSMAEIIESMAGKSGWSTGVLKWVAGTYRAPVAHITREWFTAVESLVVVPRSALAEAVNSYRPSIASADMPVDGTTGITAAYTLLPLPDVRSETYITEDGQELPREVTLGGVQHNVHAQHVCGVLLKDGRLDLTNRMSLNMRAFPLELFDTVTLTLSELGFDAQEFEVLGWQFSVDKLVQLVVKRTDADIFDPAVTLDMPNMSPNSALVLPWVVPDITGLDVDDAPGDGTQQSRVLVSWDAVTAENVRQSGKIEIQYTQAGITLPTGDWQSWQEEGGAASAVIPNLRSNFHYLFKARAINTLGVRGAWSVPFVHYVAVPLVGTDQIEIGAATEIIQGALDTTVYPGAYGVTMPGELVVTPAHDGDMTIVIYGDLSANNGTGSSTNARGRLGLSVNFSTVAGGVFQRRVAAGEVWETLVSNTYSMPVTAGVSYTIGFNYSDHVSATQTSSLTNISTRAELIYR